MKHHVLPKKGRSVVVGGLLLAPALTLLTTFHARASVLEDTTTKLYTSEVSAAHGYVETLSGGVGATGISIPGEDRGDGGIPKMERSLTKWTDAKSCAVYYFHHPKAKVNTSMRLTVTNNKEVTFRLKVTDPNKPGTTLADTTFTVKGTGSEQTIPISSVTFPAADWYRYQLECQSGNNNIQSIRRFVFESPSTAKSYVANYLSSPSVHLSNWRSTYGAPTGNVYDWCYQEVMIPADADIPGTYCMSLGVLKGYMGIQMNGYNNDGSPKHDVIFSMWDDGSTDEDPNLPEYLKAGCVDSGEGVAVSRFNNEGTGAKTFKSGNYWKAGTFVQFITNVRKETTSYTTVENGKKVEHKQNNTLVSAWYNAQDGKGWQYMATTRLRNHNNLFGSWYSFLENYNWPTGQASRRAYYRNGFARTASSKKWYHFNQVGFGHTDGGTGTGARNDYGQGATTDYTNTFYMQTGGYTKTKQNASSVTKLTDYTPVDTINLQRLIDRVEQGIAKEKAAQEEERLFTESSISKDGWKVVSFSSEETQGEGDNGRAAQTIDGNTATYWHSKWQGGDAPLPHTIVVDMGKEQTIGGYQITQSKSGSWSRYIKAYDMYFSTDNVTWTKVHSDSDAPDQASFRVLLDKPATARYFKIVVTASRAGNGPWVRINEIDMASDAVITGIRGVHTAAGTAPVISLSGRSLTVSSSAAGAVRCEVYTIDGRLVISAPQAGTYSLSHLPQGVYVVKATGRSGSTQKKVEL